MPACTLLIIDTHLTVRYALAARLARMGGVHVVGVAGRLEDAVRLAARQQPTIVLLEPKHLDAAPLIEQVVRVAPHSRIIIYTSYFDLWEKERLQQKQVSVYLLKSLDLTELLPWLSTPPHLARKIPPLPPGAAKGSL